MNPNSSERNFRADSRATAVPFAGGAWRKALALLGCLLGLASAPASGTPIPQELLEDEHFREELGVNDFTVPSIRKLFDDLDELEPIPYDQVVRKIPKPRTTDRLVLALNLGSVLADGFLFVQLKDSDNLSDLSRELVKYCNSMGVGDRVKPHGKSLLEKAYHQNWSGLKTELVATQQDVEYEMLKLRDEQIAHLISLGGWLRALEIGSQSVLADFSPEKAAKLVRPELLDYYQDRLTTLHPRLKGKPLVRVIVNSLHEIRQALGDTQEQALELEKVMEIHQIAAKTSQAIAQQ